MGTKGYYRIIQCFKKQKPWEFRSKNDVSITNSLEEEHLYRWLRECGEQAKNHKDTTWEAHTTQTLRS